MNPYNGYSGAEREAKLRARHKRRRAGLETQHQPPCAICRDPNLPVEPHAEDYAQPFLWEPPAEYGLCRTCHRSRLHKRFSSPLGWEAYKAHIRRGGYSSDLKQPGVAAEVRAYQRALDAGGPPPMLHALRFRESTLGAWWEQLTTDPMSLTASWARPR